MYKSTATIDVKIFTVNAERAWEYPCHVIPTFGPQTLCTQVCMQKNRFRFTRPCVLCISCPVFMYQLSSHINTYTLRRGDEHILYEKCFITTGLWGNLYRDTAT